MQQAIDEGADCLVTGEAAHHIAILAKQKGVGLVVAGHWGTEHPVVFALADALTERLPKEVTVAPSLAILPREKYAVVFIKPCPKRKGVPPWHWMPRPLRWSQMN